MEEKHPDEMTKEDLLETLTDIYDLVLGINLRVKSILDELETIQNKLESIPESPKQITE